VGHAQKTPLKGMRFETIEQAQVYLDRWEERWALQLAGPVQSNLLVEDLDGDGLLDLVVADRRGLHVFLSVR